jgi:hypothetical protein
LLNKIDHTSTLTGVAGRGTAAFLWRAALSQGPRSPLFFADKRA